MTYEVKSAIMALKKQANYARDLANTIEKRIRDIQDHVTTPVQPVSNSDLFSWTINDIENFIRNINFAELSRHASRIDFAELTDHK